MRRALVLAGFCMFFAACGEERREADRGDAVEPRDSGAAALWLHAADHVEPALWLARREAGRAVSERDSAVEKLRTALLAAGTRFLETDRMLANRTAQTGQMLADDGRGEEFAQLLGALSDVAAAAGQKQSYGELCQHYFNLRHAGTDRDEALRMLSERYRSRRRFR